MAIAGATCGLLYALIEIVSGSGEVPPGQAEAIAYGVGATLGGAIAFAVPAAVWNRFIR
jgi:hypothetical protein